MSSTVLYMSMSLDGFIAGPNETPDNPLGDGGLRLHEWDFSGNTEGADRQIYDEFMSTGAIVAGRGTFEPAGGWEGDHHGGVPIFILSRHPAPAWAADWPGVRYGNDIDAAMPTTRAAQSVTATPAHRAVIAHASPPKRDRARRASASGPPRS